MARVIFAATQKKFIAASGGVWPCSIAVAPSFVVTQNRRVLPSADFSITDPNIGVVAVSASQCTMKFGSRS
ncbi:hypothetical protein [Novosphingobium sp. FKTRR1]|uniref:hypothetical protein n=1 Tax=Novosphingobium sp. FKTRR1 TaxID=2879118 RepID=UPI001CF05196|nr:hypothetical protein [Novosphingobium sp. FKTRR1]